MKERLEWHSDGFGGWCLRDENGGHWAGIHRQTYRGESLWVWTAFVQPYDRNNPNSVDGSAKDLATAQMAAFTAAMKMNEYSDKRSRLKSKYPACNTQ